MSLTTTEHSASIVSHIRELLPLPRHAVFHVKLVIHQLSSVPLISGQFRIKWKFRNLQAVNSAGRKLGLGRALALKLEKRHAHPEHSEHSVKGKEKEVVQDDDEHESSEEFPIENESTYSGSASGSSNSKQSSSNAPTPASDAAGVDYRHDARGHTPFLPLRDFKVEFSQEIDVAVQMSIDKESLALQQSELKLTVMQRVIPGDPDAPLIPRLGHVQVNLAEYADAGPVTRNYLLRRSKVNAMLNMTISMTQISGEENYRAPPLRKEEIGAGIADFLSSSEPPPALSRFIPTEDPWLSNSLDFILPRQDDPPEPPEITNPADAPAPGKKRWRVAKRSRSTGPSKAPPEPSPKTTPTKKEQLHPTEALIEAIFNPYPTTSATPSPFTYYVPPAPPPPPSDGTSRGSFDSSRQASFSASEQGHESGGLAASGGRKWWRRRTNSRPVTPARSNSTRS